MRRPASSFALNLPGGQPTQAAIALARLCFDILMEYGVQAKIAVENKMVTPALEKVVEANTLLSGVGFESGGLAAAHSMQDGFTLIRGDPRLLPWRESGFPHPGAAGHGGQAQGQTIQQVYEFCSKVGLPICMEDLNIHKATPGQLMEAVKSLLPARQDHAQSSLPHLR